MLNLSINSLLKVLTIDDHGVCEDGRTWVRCSVMSFFDEDDKHMEMTAFGYYADMILDNHTGDNMRRAFVSGTLEMVKTKVTQKVNFNGVVKSVVIPDYQFQIIADSVRFIDKNTWGETDEVIVEASDDDEPIDLTKFSDDDSDETAATSGDVNFKDDDSETRTSRSRTTRDRSKSARNKGSRRVKRVVPE